MTDFTTPSYQLMSENLSSFSTKVNRLFKNNIVDKPKSVSINIFLLYKFGFKYCKRCNEIKELKDYYPDKSKALGKQGYCINCVKNKNKQQYKEDSTYAKENSKNWRLNNNGKYNALMAKRRAAKLNAQPKWLSDQNLLDIQNIYEEASKIKGHVDHIVPLQGKNVCGLHVPWNLQILTAKENLSKSNSFEELW